MKQCRSGSVGFESVSSRNNHDGQWRHCEDYIRISASRKYKNRWTYLIVAWFQGCLSLKLGVVPIRRAYEGIKPAGNWIDQHLYSTTIAGRDGASIGLPGFPLCRV